MNLLRYSVALIDADGGRQGTTSSIEKEFAAVPPDVGKVSDLP